MKNAKIPKRSPPLAALFALFAAAGCGSVLEDQPAGSDDDGATIQAEMVQDLAQAKEKYLDLAEAIPESAYGWRPDEGVRSVSEVFMHVAAANIGIIAGVLNMAPPQGADPRWYDGQNAESITDKATVVRALDASFAYVAEVIEGSSDARLTEPVNLFGSDTTVRGALLLVMTHFHEHLGQSIAYARMNGVTPPWSGG